MRVSISPSARAGPRCRSLDHFIRPRQKRRRDGQTEGFGSLQVDHQFELRGLFDREVTGLRAFENPIDVPSGATRELPKVGAVGDQSPCLNERPVKTYPGKPMLQGKCSDTHPLSIVSSAPEYDHRIGPVTFRLTRDLAPWSDQPPRRRSCSSRSIPE